MGVGCCPEEGPQPSSRKLKVPDDGKREQNLGFPGFCMAGEIGVPRGAERKVGRD